MNKERAISILSDLLEKVPGAREQKISRTEILRLISNSKSAIRNIFGESSDRYANINSISFRPGINYRDESSQRRAWHAGFDSMESIIRSCIDEIDLFWNDAETNTPEAIQNSEDQPTVEIDKRSVFVVHGRNIQLKTEFFNFLRSLGLKPLDWSQCVAQTHKASPYIGEILDSAFAHAQAAIILISPDDIAHLHPAFQSDNDPHYETTPSGQARPNVLFEAGLAFGHKPDRSILVQVGETRPFSDVAGRHLIHLNNSAQRRKELGSRLELCGCKVDWSGTDWTHTGEFESVLPETNGNSSISTDETEVSVLAKELLVHILVNGGEATIPDSGSPPEVSIQGRSVTRECEGKQLLHYYIAFNELRERDLVTYTKTNDYSMTYKLTSTGISLAGENIDTVDNFDQSNLPSTRYALGRQTGW